MEQLIEPEYTHLLYKGKYDFMADLLLYFIVLLTLNEHYIYSFGQILTSQAGGKLHSDISPYKVSKYIQVTSITFVFIALQHM